MASKTKKDKEGPWQTPQRAFVEVNDGVDDTVHDAVKQVPGTMNHSIALLRNRVNLSLKSEHRRCHPQLGNAPAAQPDLRPDQLCNSYYACARVAS